MFATCRNPTLWWFPSFILVTCNTKLAPSSLSVSSLVVANKDLFLLDVLKSVRWSIKGGNSIYSPAVYAAYGGIVSGVFGDFKTGYELGQLALSLLQGKFKERNMTARTTLYGKCGPRCSFRILCQTNIINVFKASQISSTLCNNGCQSIMGLATGFCPYKMSCCHFVRTTDWD